MRSSAKWLANASGMARYGFPTFAAITAPTIAWGVSNTIFSMIVIFIKFVKSFHRRIADIIGLMVPNLLVVIPGVILFLFIFWKKLKEDYLSDNIFFTAFYSLFGLLAGSILSIKLLPDWWFWQVVIFSFSGLLIGVLRFKLRIYEVIEAYLIAILPWFSLFFLTNSILNSNLYSFFGFSFLTLLIGLYYFLDTHYKNFSWYRSGRVGFSGLSILGVFLLARALLAPISNVVLSLAGKTDSMISGVLAFIVFLLIYNLAKTS